MDCLRSQGTQRTQGGLGCLGAVGDVRAEGDGASPLGCSEGGQVQEVSECKYG